MNIKIKGLQKSISCVDSKGRGFGCFRPAEVEMSARNKKKRGGSSRTSKHSYLQNQVEHKFWKVKEWLEEKLDFGPRYL